MCRGRAPSCGVHSLLIYHDIVVMPPVVGLRTYAKGCHACDAFVDEFGEIEPTYPSVSVGSHTPRGDDERNGE